MRRKIILWTGAVFLLGAVGFGGYTIYYYETVDLPDIELREARDRIAQAKQLESEKYSPKHFDMAETYYDSAITEWKSQNKKLFFLREHDRVKALAIRSASFAGKAIEESGSNASDLRSSLRGKIQYMNSLIDEYNTLYAHIPQAEKTQKAVFRGRLLMTEAFRAYESGDLHRSEDIVKEASALIEPSMKGLKRSLKEYFDNVPGWKDLVNKAVKKSASTGKVAIVVDKYAHKLYVYKSGKLLHTFKAELGPNWIGDKRYRGDNATPEGTYSVKTKKSGRETKYYKALLLDYPTAADKQNFEQAKKSGSLPKGAKIGSLIEIHGDGGRGVDWTNGCVALKNADMDVLFGLTSVNTSIVIVGSLRSLDEIKGSK
ncbi:MAG TPA: L,D-transpeptidase [Bacteroidales bacterium]|nr:L,D-transpeptidase [Bacteroidales bacterium]